MRDQIRIFRGTFDVAAVQADVVAHSMGGDIARRVASQADFSNPHQTYGKGLIHKLITIGTPHRGTPLATQLLSGHNDCVINQLAGQGMFSLTTVLLGNSHQPAAGAVADLRNGVSDIIPFPIAYVAGIATLNNSVGLDCDHWCDTQKLRLLCGTYDRDPIALNLTSADFSTLFDYAANDAIVPVSSQLNIDSFNGVPSWARVRSNVIHSEGAEGLGFLGPFELESGSAIPDIVMNLLNEGTDSDVFSHRTAGIE